MKTGLNQPRTAIVRRALSNIEEQAANAQSAFSHEEISKLVPMDAAQLLCDAHRALHATLTAAQAISAALRKAIADYAKANPGEPMPPDWIRKL